MKRSLFLLLSIVWVFALTGCEDVIDLNAPIGSPQVVVDGWITNQPGPQTIKLTRSAGYFDNAPAPALTGATVRVTDNRGRTYQFLDPANRGVYTWTPVGTDTLGRIGSTYTLTVATGTDTYQATTSLRRVPPIDSLTYYFEKPTIAPGTGPKEGFVAQFFARDPVGAGDCYWIKTYKNGKYFNRPSDIILAYDAAFSPGSPSDGLLFILPIRQAITRELYAERDTARIELFSVSLEAFYFLQQVQEESANGGIFATAPSNIRTNVVNTNPKGPKALGFFGASAVSTFQTVFDKSQARPKP